MSALLLSTWTFAVVSIVSLASHVRDYPFRNTSLDWDSRVDDLVSRLTLQEVVLQMAMGGGGTGLPAPAIHRLGISAYQYNTECLRGIVNLDTTAFPQALGLAASFSKDLLYVVAEAIGTEARAVFNNASRHGDYGLMKGISCFSPFINILRHPLWGRVQEVYGEDPYLSGILAAAYVKGLQGNDKRFVRASSGCKVVGLYSGPEDIPVSRFGFNANVSERDLRLTYFPPFKACIDAGTYNLMCSYYSLNGVPGCTHKWLLTNVVRGEFGFRGYVITDEGALNNAVTYHKYYPSVVEAAAAGTNAGVNLELPDSSPAYLHLMLAVQRGLVKKDTLLDLVKPLFYTRMRLGEFDPKTSNPYSSIDVSVIESRYHRDLAGLAATKTFVLLKNEAATLPFTSKLRRLAVLGPMSNDVAAMFGNYAPQVQAKYSTSPLDGLRKLADIVDFVPGCSDILCNKYDSEAVGIAAAQADAVIVCLGNGVEMEAEGKDRGSLDLPGHQHDLLRDAYTYAKKPVVLLLFTAGPVNISDAKNNTNVGAILLCFYPGQSTGDALRRVLSVGDNGTLVSPAARLPYTWPASLIQVPPMVNYSMEGRTYRYFKGPGAPLYPFGYGLSYTSFKYASLVIRPSVVRGPTNITLEASLSNTGSCTSDEVIQVYVSWRNSSVLMPRLQLVSVQRVTVTSRQTARVSANVSTDELRVWHDDNGFILAPGYIDVYVGGQQPNQATSISSNVLHGEIHITPSAAGSNRPRRKRMNRLTVAESDSVNHNSVVKL